MKTHHKLFSIALLSSVFFAGALPPANAETIDILSIGDSITLDGRSDRAQYPYRYPLFYNLKDVAAVPAETKSSWPLAPTRDTFSPAAFFYMRSLRRWASCTRTSCASC